MQARAAIADGAGNFSLESIEVGDPLGDEVLVEIKASGICHTDHASLSWKRPLVMGHEGAGVVVKVGPEVRHVRAGDRVVLNWVIPCGTCASCERGEEVLCEVSKPAYVMEPSAAHAHAEGSRWKSEPVDRSFNIGTLAELTLVRAAAVTRLPEGVPFASACIVGCGVMTGFGSAVNIARVEAGASVAVLGCGGVGLNVIQGARLQGAGKIIALDARESALENAMAFGATEGVLVKEGDEQLENAIAEVHAINGDRGVDYAFEATAIPKLGRIPLQLARNGGLALQVSGIYDPGGVVMPGVMWTEHSVAPL